MDAERPEGLPLGRAEGLAQPVPEAANVGGAGVHDAVEVVVPAYVDGRGDLRVGVDRLAGRGVGLHGATGSGGGVDAGTERLEEAHARGRQPAGGFVVGGLRVCAVDC